MMDLEAIRVNVQIPGGVHTRRPKELFTLGKAYRDSRIDLRR
jgi:hypothetical protein